MNHLSEQCPSTAIFCFQAATLRFEKEKEDIEKNRSVKLKKKKEAMTLRLQKEQQEVTAKLVEKHSRQMLELLKQEQEKLKQELEEEIVSHLENFLFFWWALFGSHIYILVVALSLVASKYAGFKYAWFKLFLSATSFYPQTSHDFNEPSIPFTE